MRRLALFAAVVFAVLLGLVVAWRLQDIVLVLVASLAAAATVRAPIQWLQVRRVPTGVAVILVYLGAGLAASLVLLLLYDRLGRELGSVAEDLGYVYARVRAEFRFLGAVSPSLTARFPTPEQLTQQLTDSEFGSLEHSVIAAGRVLAGLVGDAALVLILSVYWTADRLRFERLVLSFVPANRRPSVRSVWRSTELRLGYYLRGELLQSLLAGSLMALALLVLDVRWAVFWALAVAVAWLVPMVGGLLVIGPMTIVISVQSGLLVAGLAVAAVLLIAIVLQGVLGGLLQKRERGANVLTLMTALVMTDAFGLIGLVLSPPVAQALYALLSEIGDPVARAAPATAAPDVASLLSRLERTRQLIPADEGDRQARRLRSLADRLGLLLEEAASLAD